MVDFLRSIYPSLLRRSVEIGNVIIWEDSLENLDRSIVPKGAKVEVFVFFFWFPIKLEEQNLRQGRIKNVRSPTTVAQQPIHNSRSDRETQRTSRSRSVSPLSSPEERSSSPELDDKSPSISPIPFGFSPVPFNTLSTPSPVPLPFSNNTPLLSATNILAPSPLNVRLGMTPSPISMSPSLSMMGTSSGFSPVQMSATTPIYLPKPSAVKEFSTPIKQERPTKRQRGNEDSSNNLTLAPILT
eukprot:TRINITY_DN79_c0_g1_i2.p1 TRINITY_DN79_c0_g1~~TRINITY_DN79_c0_g1_i2.p1  ORF type:complete len:242 (+),score=50.66 TRINITY_DN79_c0_g1_i2:303-1028(+)